MRQLPATATNDRANQGWYDSPMLRTNSLVRALTAALTRRARPLGFCAHSLWPTVKLRVLAVDRKAVVPASA